MSTPHPAVEQLTKSNPLTPAILSRWGFHEKVLDSSPLESYHGHTNKAKEIYMERHNQNYETSQHFETEPKLPKVETVNLTTFEELQDYAVGDIFSSPVFEVKIPITDEDYWVYTCRFLNPERAEEYYAACCRTEDLDEFDSWNYRLQEEKVEILNIEIRSQV